MAEPDDRVPPLSGEGEGGFEARLARLERIVRELEREDLELEDSLRLFEEGIGHLRAAQARLRSAEQRIERLLEDESGETILEPIDPGSPPS